MSNPTILCVDDERNVLLTLRSQLLRHFPDYTIEIAESGSEALDLVEELVADGIDIPLVIADQIMPGMKGDDLLIELQTRHPKIVKVMLTGQARAEDVGNVVNRGNLYRFIAKPWNEVDLTLTVHGALRLYQQEHQLAEQRIALEQSNRELQALNASLDQQIQERTHALQQSEARFRAMFEQVAVGVGLCNPQTGAIEAANEWLCEFLGYTEAELTQLTWVKLTYPEDREAEARLMSQFHQDNLDSFTHEKRYICKDGAVRWVNLTVSLVRSVDGNPLYNLAIIQDIHHRKQAEAALRHSEAKQRALIAALPDLIMRVSGEGIYLDFIATDTFKTIGNTGDFVGTSVHESLPPDLAAKRMGAIRAALHTGQLQVYEQDLVVDGAVQTEECRVVVCEENEVLIIGRDITHRKQAERKLRASEANLIAAQRIAHIGNWEFDLTTQEIKWSAELFRMFGLDPTQPTPSYPDYLQKIHPDDRPTLLRCVEEAITQGKDYVFDYRALLPDGSIRYHEARGEVLRNEQGQIITLFGTGLDITERKLAEDALRLSENRYATLAEVAPVGIFRVDADGACVYVNDRWSVMTGRPIDFALGYGWINTLHPEDRDRISTEWNQAHKQGGHFQGEGRYLRPDGSIIWFYCQVLPETDDEGTIRGYIGTLTDITERKRLEEDLRQSQAFLQSIYNGTEVAISVLEVLENDDYRYLSVNPTTARLAGVTPDFFEGKTLADLACLSPMGYDNVLSCYQRCVTTRETVQFEEKNLVHGKETWWLTHVNPLMDGQGYVTKLIVSAIPITDRKQAEAALHQSNAYYQSLVDALPQCVYRKDLEGRFTFANHAYLKNLGMSLEELIGSTVADLYSPEMAEQYTVDDNLVLQGEIVDVVKACWTPEQSDTLYLQVVKAPIYNLHGHVIGIQGIFWDVTERMRLQHALQQMNQDLELRVQQRTQELNQQTQLLQTILNSMGDGVLVANQAGEIILQNRAAASIIGLDAPKTNLRPETWRDFWGIYLPDGITPCPVDQVPLMRGLRGESLNQVEVVLRNTPHSNDIYVETTVRPLADDAGEQLGAVAVFRDVTERKQTARQLEAERLRLQLALESAQMGTWESNLDTGTWSERTEEIFGYAPGTFPGDRDAFLRLIHTDDQERVFQALAHSFTTASPYNIDYRINRSDGEIRWVSVSGNVVANPDGSDRRIVGVAVDITDRKRVEHILAEKNAMLQSVIESTPDVIFVKDAVGRLMIANSAFAQFFNQPLADLIGKDDADLWPPDFAQQLRDLDSRIMMRGSFETLEETVPHSSGIRTYLTTKSPWYNAEGTVIGTIGLSRDISDRKRTEQVLRDNEERLRLALTAASQGLYDLNIRTGETIVSPEYATMLGYDPETFQETNDTWIARLHPEDLDRVSAHYLAYIRGEISTYQIEFRQRTQTGDWKWTLSVGKIVSWDEAGQPLRMLGTHTDISDRKQMEAALRNANAQLAEYSQTLEQRVKERTVELQAAQERIIAQEKLASLGTLTAGVAHELRNPLNFVKNYAESSIEMAQDLLDTLQPLMALLEPPTLALTQQLVHDLQENAGSICHHSNRAEKIVASMMQHAHTDSSNSTPQPTDFHLLLDQAIKLAYHGKHAQDPDASFNISFQIDFDPSQPMVDLVAANFSRAIINLVENAYDAMQTQQTLLATISHSEVSKYTPTLAIKTRVSAGRVILQIRDNGCGIDPQIQAKIMEPFFTTKPPGKGTGLGLSLTHDIIVNQHRGQLSIASEVSKFTEFTVELPLQQTPPD